MSKSLQILIGTCIGLGYLMAYISIVVICLCLTILLDPPKKKQQHETETTTPAISTPTSP